MKNARAKRAKILFFIVKYANLWGLFSCRRRSCLIKLPSLAPREELINMETTVPFGRAISVRQLPFAVLSDNVF